MGCCQASGRGWGTSLATKLWWERAEQHKKFPLCSPGWLGEMVPSPTFGLRWEPPAHGQTLGKGYTGRSCGGLTGSSTDPSVLAPAPTLRQNPDHRAWHYQHPLKQLLQKQPLKPGDGVGTRCRAQRSISLCFPSHPAPTRPGSRGRGHCAGPQGSDCLAAPADGWHRPRASSLGPRMPRASLGLGDLQAKNSLPGPCLHGVAGDPSLAKGFQELPRASRARRGGCNRSPTQWAVPAPTPPSPPLCQVSMGMEPQRIRVGDELGCWSPPRYPGFHPEGWQGKEKSLPGKVHHLHEFSGDSGTAAVAAARPRQLCVVGVSVIFPAHGGGTHSSRGFTPL